jgi:hypothetical protein
MKPIYAIVAAAGLLPASMPAQSSANAYTLQDIVEYVHGGVGAMTILSMSRTKCISFRITPAVSERLRSEGADSRLIDGLRGTCYRGADARDIPDVRRDPVVSKLKVIHDTIYVDRVKERIVYKHDTVTVTSLLDWVFVGSHPLPAGRRADCEFDYSSAGYSIGVLKYGPACVEGPPTELPAFVRIAATATPIKGLPSASYGLEFCVSGDSMYIFKITQGGQYQLSLFRHNRWEDLSVWEKSPALQSGVNVPNKLAVEIRANVVTLFANGTKLGMYTTSYPPVGKARIGILRYENASPLPAVTFSQFLVTRLF